MEGLHCFETASCDQAGLTLPIAEYSSDDGCSVTGGYVYRGAAWPALEGIYVFGDYCSGLIWGLGSDGGGADVTLLLESELSISAFGQGDDGELYLVDHAGGGLYAVGMP